MDESQVHWLADGFRVRFHVPALPFSIRPELVLLYAILGTIVGVTTHLLAAGLLFLPSVLLLWWSAQRHTAEIEVTHDRLVASAPLRPTLRLPIRDVRHIEVFDDELELELWGGRRLRVPCPAPGPRLQWVVRQMRRLRDEAQAFALEMAETVDEAAPLKSLLQAPR